MAVKVSTGMAPGGSVFCSLVRLGEKIEYLARSDATPAMQLFVEKFDHQEYPELIEEKTD